MIYGGRVRLRAIEREDIPRFNDPEVRRYLTMYRPLSRAEEERWVESLEVVSHLFAFTPAVSPRS